MAAINRPLGKEPAPESSYDVCVYGSTPGGVAAAIEAARRGCAVLLACPKTSPGGMTASGLCTTDAVRQELFSGLLGEFISGVRNHYKRLLPADSPDHAMTRNGWFYEPSVAEEVFEQMLSAQSDRLQFWRGHHLMDAQVCDSRVTQATFVSPKGEQFAVKARTFIDATYEGDLAAAAKVPYRVGREGRDEFGESRAGIHYMNWRTGEQIDSSDTGEPSLAIQAFCARSVFTNDPEHLVPIEKPPTYEEHLPDLLPLLEDFNSGRLRNFGYGAKLPRRKFELNGSITGLTSLNCPGISWNWPEASREFRRRLERFHIDHAASLIWFLQHQPGVPNHVAELWRQTGLHRDEFKSSGHWPWQIYVRQGRRIEGRARVTQHNFMLNPRTGFTPRVQHPIAIGEHSFDVHPCHDRRFAIAGYMEGVLWYPKKASGPAQPGQVPFGALLPLWAMVQKGKRCRIKRGMVIANRSRGYLARF